MNFVPILFKGVLVFVSSDFVTLDDRYPEANGIVAEQIANEWNAALPTPELVDEIYEQATCKVTSPALDPSKEESFLLHEKAIKKNIAKCEDTTLLAGHKKTIVQSNKPNRLAIYGWFDKSGQRIQPYSTVHSKDYADYSHGVRLIKKIAIKDGKMIDVSNVLGNQ